MGSWLFGYGVCVGWVHSRENFLHVGMKDTCRDAFRMDWASKIKNDKGMSL